MTFGDSSLGELDAQLLCALDYRELADALPQLIWCADAQGRIEFFNRRWVEYTGASVERMRTPGAKGIVHPDDLPLTWERWKGALATGEPYEIEYRLRSAADGSYRWFLARAVPLRAADGHVERWIGSATDIEERKRASDGLQFVVEAVDAFKSTLDAQMICDTLARLAIPRFADWCAIEFVDENDRLRAASVAHIDRERLAAADAFRRRNPLRERPDVLARLRKDGSILEAVVTDEQLRAGAIDDDHYRLMASLNIRSALVVPLSYKNDLMGTMTLISAESGRTYGPADVAVAIEVARRAAISLHTALAFDEQDREAQRLREVANALQRAALPSVVSRPDGLRLDTVYSPASTDLIGGDWYDALELEDGSLMVSVGDVSGRGIPAATIMAKVRHGIDVLPMSEGDPARILDIIDWLLRQRLPDAVVTAFVGIISADRSTIRYANAGHLFPLVRLRNGNIVELPSSGLPLGLRDQAPRAESAEASLRDAELLVLFTDGLVESDRDWERGFERLRTIVSTDAVTRVRMPAHLIHDACLPTGSPDDVAILTVGFGPPRGWTFSADDAFGAQSARSQFLKYLRECRVDDPVAANAESIFGELVGNVLRHASGPIEIHAENGREGFDVHVFDRGPAFLLRRDLPVDPLSEAGRGLSIIARLGGQIRLERIPEYGNHVFVRLPHGLPHAVSR